MSVRESQRPRLLLSDLPTLRVRNLLNYNTAVTDQIFRRKPLQGSIHQGSTGERGSLRQGLIDSYQPLQFYRHGFQHSKGPLTMTKVMKTRLHEVPFLVTHHPHMRMLFAKSTPPCSHLLQWILTFWRSWSYFRAWTG